MSGGHFNYNQYKIREISDAIESEIIGNKKRDYQFSKETIAQFRNGLRALKIAEIYAQRIDWLLSYDDGEESFHERLKKDLEELEIKKQKGS